MKILNLGFKIIQSNFKNLEIPYKLTFAITYSCDSRCKTCNIWKKKTEGELSTKEIKDFFHINQFPWINLTGGEVFCRKNLMEIINAIQGTFLLNITTNGIQTNKIVKNCKKINKKFPKFVLTVSIDGPKEIHNWIRGIKCWEKAVDTLKKIRKADIESYIGYTFSPYNIGYLEETFQDIKKKIPDIGMKDFHINFYHESDIYYNNENLIDEQSGFKEKLKRNVDMFLKKKKGLYPISFLERKYLKFIEKYIQNGTCPLPCEALSSSCYIDPKGNVYPCIFLNNKLGNIKETDFKLKPICNSKKAIETRRKIKERRCPGCWTPCEAYQTILGNLSKVILR